MPVPLPTPAAPFLPHRPPMAMVDTLVANGPDGKCASCTIRPDNLFLDGDGRLDPVVIPELVAQAAAASDSHTHDGTVRPGFLALARTIRIHRTIRVNDQLFITATDESPIDNWFVITFAIRLADQTLCAEGEISVCLL